MLNIIVLSIILYYTVTTNDCLCSQGWKKEFMKYFSAVSIILHIAKKKFNLSFLHLPSAIATVIFIYIIFTFPDDDCPCADHWILSAMKVYGYALIVMLIAMPIFRISS